MNPGPAPDPLPQRDTTWPRPYQIRLAGLTQLQAALGPLGVPAVMLHNQPQMASSFPNDYWQPVLWCGDDDHGYQPVKFLYARDERWYYAVDTWSNDRGNDVTQVAGELLLWYTEQSGPVRM